MLKRLCTLLAVLVLAACSPSNLISQPSNPTPQATTAPINVEPTEAPEPDTTGAPTATGQQLPTAAPSEPVAVDDPAMIAEAKPEERDQTQLVEAFKGTGDLPDAARTEPLQVKVGDVETFWVSDLADNSNYEVKAKLRYAGPVVLMYVDTAVDGEISQADIERSAKEFEDSIYERNRALFGSERTPGIDADPRLTILNTPLNGAGGYFSSADGVVKAVNRYSNEREMFVIGINSYPLGDPSYGATLAHEFQHMIEWNEARRSPSWFNEGMSTLAEDLNGYVDDYSTYLHVAEPDIQLNTWSSDSAQTGRHYGTSRLFLRYFQEQYGDDNTPAELIKADAGNNVEAFVPIAQRVRPEITSFADIVADWAVANLLNDTDIDGGRYAYELLPEKVEPQPAARGGRESVSQYGADYLELPEGATLQFDGSDTVTLAGTELPEGGHAWWSNRGDDGVQTLTREFDLTGVSQATLDFSMWHEIELDWDYAYVAVSTDGGQNWTALKGSTTTDYDPQGANFGNGITGVSGSPETETDKGTEGEWIEEQMDLTPFAGKQIQLRFWMINDAAYNAAGMLVDNIRIPEIDYAYDAETDDGWQAQGFVRTTGELQQEWALRLVRGSGSSATVEPVAVDERGRAQVSLNSGESGVLVVLGSTPFTTEPASYDYSVK